MQFETPFIVWISRACLIRRHRKMKSLMRAQFIAFSGLTDLLSAGVFCVADYVYVKIFGYF